MYQAKIKIYFILNKFICNVNFVCFQFGNLIAYIDKGSYIVCEIKILETATIVNKKKKKSCIDKIAD